MHVAGYHVRLPTVDINEDKYSQDSKVPGTTGIIDIEHTIIRKERNGRLRNVRKFKSKLTCKES